MGELAEQQSDHMAPCAKPSAFAGNAVLLREPPDQPDGDKLANLMEYVSVMLGWFGFVFHLGFFGRKPTSSQPFFLFANLEGLGFPV
jgi:hypothetical protein